MTLSPIIIFLLSFTIGSLGGLAYVTRPGETLTWRIVISAMMLAGCTGLGASLWLYERYGQTPAGQWKLLGISIALGIAGPSGTELLIKVIDMAARIVGTMTSRTNIRWRKNDDE